MHKIKMMMLTFVMSSLSPLFLYVLNVLYVQALVCLVREMGCKDAEVVECALQHMAKSSIWKVSLNNAASLSSMFFHSFLVLIPILFLLNVHVQDRLQSIKLLNEIGTFVGNGAST